MPYLPIEDYGVIGDMHTAALVGRNGSIDWLCLPHFDSPSVFAALLDDAKGGRFRIAPTLDDGLVTSKQLYWPQTNVLLTRFLSPEGVGEITDYMTVGPGPADPHWLIRRVRSVRGAMQFRMECRPAFDYARAPHRLELSTGGALFHGPGLTLALGSPITLQRSADGAGVEALFTLPEGESVTFVLRKTEPGAPPAGLSEAEASELFRRTVEFWQRWISRCTYRGRWREIVHRSALMLKLLTFEPTGAIVAAPTCSLPEAIGGPRNWDYRYTWIRDAAFTLYAFLRIGFTDEAAAFMQWIEARCKEVGPDGSLQIMYALDGRHRLEETTLDHLEGYRGSKPVRIGNGAYGQLQLDIYGELLDSVYLYDKHGSPISWQLWSDVRRLVNWVCEHWRDEDEGIWEVRGGRRHFVYSKLMCWVALDRAVRLARKRSFPCERERWESCRDAIYEELMAKGWSDSRRAFVQSYGGDTLDAANLMMPLTFFVGPNDPRMISTLDEMGRSPASGGLLSNGLVFRYDVAQANDGLTGAEGTFNICTFWFVEALARAGRVDRGRLDSARLLFEQMLGYANHLGLYGEETGPRGEALGNYPQAFTHLALISAAYNLDRVLDGK